MNAWNISISKPTFYGACRLYDLDYELLSTIAKMAEVDTSIINAMFIATPVHKADATKVLTTFSEVTGTTWTLDTVKIALLPTLAEVCNQHTDLSLVDVAQIAGVSYAITHMMQAGEPVSEQEARYVLRAVSQKTGQDYTLENTDVALLPEGEHHA